MLLLVIFVGRWYARRCKAANELRKKELDLIKKEQFGGIKSLLFIIKLKNAV